ncbi:MAG: 2-dehydro-3-deoxy-6-phosphogalactonate aldolase [Lentisphaerae bacterium]|jgi:2-dehydro-3-deoxyphosphogalactonate aldolase|nr:2-dehydro-3-deoxy-6-phosphogalactonate aldolase [Lentisphaerota bacterium]MBT4815009.1 2-dehydro-3-deoxy-6-phosphogalactonate aldolase [Lentisphaerota bacterium]MBT5607852.1 2-dehydro-3-deoxy-6-phosphogalactonate aldolase [Lentisphaerota bacterium]MBT7054834.1 2-dehydro-3-deoxy-6-phosphogalactonate aldolase [Lentisphaerota bacterium]MBT7845574.1 2-dehydro-3-deoxy-6-phosphogalactonate aldolase [Lentisphaerota bacterium]
MALDRDRFDADLADVPVVAILRGVTPETILPVGRALAEGGIRFIEVTLNSPDAATSIRLAVQELASRGVHIGAGTVLTPSEVAAVAGAGGTYIISPNFNESVVRKTKELGLVSIPGFLTPTEGFAAAAAGADLLKCFPARALGPGYIKDLKAVLPNPIVAVGGVNTENVGDYLKVAVGVGVGSALYKADKTMDDIQKDTAQYLAAVAAVQEAGK